MGHETKKWCDRCNVDLSSDETPDTVLEVFATGARKARFLLCEVCCDAVVKAIKRLTSDTSKPSAATIPASPTAEGA